jgi:hypothetical protein
MSELPVSGTTTPVAGDEHAGHKGTEFRLTVLPRSERMAKAGVAACLGCDKKFSLLTRKHCCNTCGKVMCATCTKYRIKLRLCGTCDGAARAGGMGDDDEDEAAGMQSVLDNLGEALAEAKHAAHERSDRVNTLEAALIDRDTRVAQLEATVRELQHAHEVSLAASAADHAATLAAVHKEHAASLAALQSKHAAEAEAAATAHAATLEAARAEHAAAAAASLDAARAEHAAAAAALTGDFQAAAAAAATAATDADTALRAELAAAHATIAALEARIAALEAELAALRASTTAAADAVRPRSTLLNLFDSLPA